MAYHDRKVYSTEYCIAIYEAMASQNSDDARVSLKSPYTEDASCSLLLEKPLIPSLLDISAKMKKNPSMVNKEGYNFKASPGQKKMNPNDIQNRHHNQSFGRTTGNTSRGGSYSHTGQSRGGATSQSNPRSFHKDSDGSKSPHDESLTHLSFSANKNSLTAGGASNQQRPFSTSNRFTNIGMQDRNSRHAKETEILTKLVDDLQVDDLDSQFEASPSPKQYMDKSEKKRPINNKGRTVNAKGQNSDISDNFFNVSDNFYTSHSKKTPNRQLDRQNLHSEVQDKSINTASESSEINVDNYMDPKRAGFTNKQPFTTNATTDTSEKQPATGRNFWAESVSKY